MVYLPLVFPYGVVRMHERVMLSMIGRKKISCKHQIDRNCLGIFGIPCQQIVLIFKKNKKKMILVQFGV